MTFLSILLVVFGFGLIIFTHELGHFLFAKALGFKVEEFAVGFGKPLIQRKHGQTLYSIRLIPLGGFNKIPEIDSTYVSKPLSPSYYIRRVLVVGAGAMFNFLSAFVAIALLLSLAGVPRSSSVIQEIHPEISSHATHFQANDKILSVNGAPYINDTQALLSATNLNIEVERNGEIVPISFYKDAGQPVGISFKNTYQTVPLNNIIPASVEGFKAMAFIVTDSFKLLVNMPTHDLVKSTAGPIGIAHAMFKAEQETGLIGFTFLFALISINIGIMNLLPIPVLDGGRIFIDTIQLIFRNIIPKKGIHILEYAGLTVMSLLFILGFVGDIYRLITF